MDLAPILWVVCTRMVSAASFVVTKKLGTAGISNSRGMIEETVILINLCFKVN